MRFIPACAALGIILSLASPSPRAQAVEPELQQVLEGFDEPASAPARKDELQGVLDGFDAAQPSASRSAAPPVAVSPWRASGSVSASSAQNIDHAPPAAGQTDFRGLSRLRLKAGLDAKIVINDDWQAYASAMGFYDAAYRINDRDQYTEEVLDSYESELELQEAYVAGSLRRNLDVKLGRQIVVWGKSDSIRVVDVLNPLDLREPGMVDIEDLRLPVTMLRSDYFVGAWGITAIAIPEIRYNKLPPYGSDFYPAAVPPPNEAIPANSLEHTEYAFAVNGTFSAWDISFNTARVYDDQAHSELVAPGQIERRHSLLTMFGLAANAVRGSWLYKTEAAWFDGLNHFAKPNQDYTRLDVMAGLEYSGYANTSLALEAVNRHLFDYDAALAYGPDGTSENEQQLALRYTGNFLHDRLEVTLLASLYGWTGDDGAFYRGAVKYDLRDALAVSAGLVVYRAGDDLVFQKIARNDRAFVELRYDFDLR